MRTYFAPKCRVSPLLQQKITNQRNGIVVKRSVVNFAIFKSPSSLVASTSPQNFKVTSPQAMSPCPHVTSSLLSTRHRVLTNMIADYSTFTNL